VNPTSRRLAAAGSVLLATVLTGAAMAGTAEAATWRVDHPPFTSQSTVSYAPLAAVTATSASNVWAVGRADGANLIDHWNGSTWSSVALPPGPCDVFESDCQLTGVSASSASNIIAVGHATLNDNGAGWLAASLAYRYDGTSWRPLALPSDVPFWSIGKVEAFSPTDAWTIGADGSTGSAVTYHFDGTSFTRVANPMVAPAATPVLSVNAIAGTSGHDIWVGGQDQTSGYRHVQRHSLLMHYDGAAWTTQSIPDTGGILDLAALSPTNVWALGFDGSVLHWDGATWSTATSSPGGQVLGAVSATNVWVAGAGGFAHFDGTSWTASALPAGVLGLTGSAVAGGHVWLSGYDVLADNATYVPAVLSQ
jgi:hypothetical protein